MERITQFIKDHRYHIGLVGIILLAAWLRFYKLDVIPPGLHPDEAANGLDVFKILEQNDFRPFYDTNGGREALFFYLQAISVKIFGNTILALRLVPALIGVLAVGAVYLLASNWFGRRTGWVAAALMAVTPWAVIVSRDGYRAGMVALMVPLTLWLYTKAIQTNNRWWYVAAGASLGAGFYTYISFRAMVVALAVAAIATYIWRRESIRLWLPGIGISLAAMLVVLLPLGWYSAQNPEEVFGRAGGVSFLNPDLNDGKPIQTLGSSIVKTALMFNVSGDENYRHNIGGEPQLNIFVGIMFLFGIVICVKYLRKLRHLALLATFLIMLLPAMVSAEGLPHALRSIGALPLAMILAAIGINYMLRKWHSVFPINAIARGSGTAAIALLMVLTAYQGYVGYFVAWANAPQTHEAFNEPSVELAKYYNTNPFEGKRYAAVDNYLMMPVDYLTHNKAEYKIIDSVDINTLPVDKAAKEFSFLASDRDKMLQLLNVKYPNGRVVPHFSAYDERELFTTYSVPAS